MPRYVSYVPLRWADLDAYGHVNNVIYLRYLQEARVDMLLGRDPAGGGMFGVQAPRHGAERLADGVIVVRHEIDYRAPLRFRPQPVRVETWVTDVTNARFTLSYEVMDDDADEAKTVYATASTTLVPYNLKDGRPRRIAPAEKAVLEEFRA